MQDQRFLRVTLTGVVLWALVAPSAPATGAAHATTRSNPPTPVPSRRATAAIARSKSGGHATAAPAGNHVQTPPTRQGKRLVHVNADHKIFALQTKA